MAEKDKFAGEMLTDDELDNVASGNSYEYFDIVSSIQADFELREQFHYKEGDTAYLKNFLHDNFGVDAEFNMNEGNDFDGTPNLNKYKDVKTGNSLTHNDVIYRIYSYHNLPELI